MTEFTLCNARVVGRDEVFTGAVRVAGSAIAAVDRSPASPRGAEDLEGDYLLPGLVDVHTDNLERHMLPRSSARWPGAAALLAHDAQVAGVGITTVLDAVCLGLDHDPEGRPRDFYMDSAAALREASEAGGLRADHLLHLRCELPGTHVVEQLERLVEEPLLRMVSLMDHTPGQRQTRDLERVRRFAERQGGLSDREWEAKLEEWRQRQRRYAAENRTRLLGLLEGRTAVLASHDDTTVEHVEEAHSSGIRICEFPTTLAAARAARERGMSTVMGAPNVVLGRSQSGNVAASDLAREGLLDCLSSDYAPVSMLHSAFLLAGGDEAALPAAVMMVSRTPALLVGLDDRGAVEPGLRADLLHVRLCNGVPRVVQVWRAGRRVA